MGEMFPMTGVAWGAIVTLTIFVLTNIGLMIHWSAKISTLLEVVQQELKHLAIELHEFKGVYSTKEELAFTKLMVDKEFAAVWKRMDELKTAAKL